MSQSAVLERDELAPRHPGGRPTLYRPEYCERAKELCRNGATNVDLAHEFGVSTFTIGSWQVSYREFSDATRVGKKRTDDRVERSLLERATGASWIEEHPVTLREVRINLETKERVESQRVEVVRLLKSAPPDTQAASMWLINRRRKEWKQRQEIEHTGIVTLAALVESSLKSIEARSSTETIEGHAQELSADNSDPQAVDIVEDTSPSFFE